MLLDGIAAPAAPHAESLSPVSHLIEEEERRFVRRQPRSRALHARAVASLAGGVTSNWQITRPQPVFIARGTGSRIVDVDGTEYVDLHGGYGAGLAGHAHPAIVEALTRQVRNGTHFAQPNEDAVVVAELLAGRFGLPLWRFTNSGTEATMDAVHLMRAVTGRDLIVKIEGCYHGHHDSVQVSVAPDEDEGIGAAARPIGRAASSGIPDAITSLTLVATFNDLDGVRRLLEEHPRQVAGMILEPIMMNAGIVHPVPDYLEGLRSLLHDHGALLCFDEVKTGLTVGPGGATRLLGVTPDIVCLAKSLGGGIVAGAVGATRELMGYVESGDYVMVGTFNGHPLSMAACRAVLAEVATDAGYARIAALRAQVDTSMSASIERHGLPAHLVSVGAKGCVTFATS
ncbi:MAG TPA: aminotransferase class III-fold pyridoxal phosphate-dependent enzyme, partial [Acidimicrobiales bacterium]|nr:aminotransferase class III-fold pyridoxal phosphate-dependent enzyme [Acidimicrobiales bacterium]